jgi:hypothetical protein
MGPPPQRRMNEWKVPQYKKNQVLKDDCWIMGPPSRSQMRSHDRHIRVLRVFVPSQQVLDLFWFWRLSRWTKTRSWFSPAWHLGWDLRTDTTNNIALNVKGYFLWFNYNFNRFCSFDWIACIFLWICKCLWIWPFSSVLFFQALWCSQKWQYLST